jgi:pimeloyl-ACP methyl ester carboxylesterase
MPERYVLAAIDGSGSSEWRRKDGANSHVFRFKSDFADNGGAKEYWHGPNWWGQGLSKTIDDANSWIIRSIERLISKYRCGQQEVKVCLVGHSRGAAAGIALANRLNDPTNVRAVSRSLRAPIQVHFLALYDTVNRSPLSIDCKLTNVKHCFHACRQNISMDPEKGSRGSFGLVKVPGASPAQFDTSHGGIGGDPGFFTRLDDPVADLYCNAWTFLLSQLDLDKMFGTGFFGRHKYTSLAGEERVRRKAALRRFWNESMRANEFVRNGAASAGLTLGSCTACRPFPEEHEKRWNELHAELSS